MLTKLLKYDVKKMFRFLSVFFLLSLFFGILTRAFNEVGDSLLLQVLSSIANGTAISMMFSILINCFMRTWVTFRSSFYGDESYLTHTLPISKGTLYLSKAITAYISVLISLAVILLTICIMYLNKETSVLLESLLQPLASFFETDISVLIFLFLFVLFLELIAALQWGLMGIILGHRLISGKILFSVLIGFCLYIGSQITVLLVMLICALSDPGFMELFKAENIFSIDPSTARITVLIATGCYLVFVVLGHVLNIRFLEKGVNVE